MRGLLWERRGGVGGSGNFGGSCGNIGGCNNGNGGGQNFIQDGVDSDGRIARRGGAKGAGVAWKREVEESPEREQDERDGDVEAAVAMGDSERLRQLVDRLAARRRRGRPVGSRDRQPRIKRAPCEEDCEGEVTRKKPWKIILTAEQAVEIYAQRPLGQSDATASCRSNQLAARYGVNSKTIRDIWNRTTWVRATRSIWLASEEADYVRQQLQAMQAEAAEADAAAAAASHLLPPANVRTPRRPKAHATNKSRAGGGIPPSAPGAPKKACIAAPGGGTYPGHLGALSAGEAGGGGGGAWHGAMSAVVVSPAAPAHGRALVEEAWSVRAAPPGPSAAGTGAGASAAIRFDGVEAAAVGSEYWLWDQRGGSSRAGGGNGYSREKQWAGARDAVQGGGGIVVERQAVVAATANGAADSSSESRSTTCLNDDRRHEGSGASSDSQLPIRGPNPPPAPTVSDGFMGGDSGCGPASVSGSAIRWDR